MKRPNLDRIWMALLGLISAAAVVRLFRAGWIDSMDFAVYWKAAQAWVEGQVSPYSVVAGKQGFVFKYPPFLLPLFLPLGYLGFDLSKILWACVELACLIYAWLWLLRQGVSRKTTLLVVFLFWWIWLAHFYAGQFTLVLMAVALWAVRDENPPPARLATLGLIFTAKVFSITTLIGLRKQLLRVRVFASAAAILLASHILLLLYAHGSLSSVVSLYQGWVSAALSGGTELGPEVIRGQMNHGFTAGVLRWSGVPAERSSYDVIVSLALTAFFAGLWFRFSRSLTLAERWAGWLGVGLITHPLAWHHSYVLAFPLCALSLDRSLRSGQRDRIALSVLGILCIGIFIPNVIGPELVRPLELVSVKSWGVVFSGIALVLSVRTRNRN